MCEPAWLPELALLEDYGGDWPAYLDSVYGAFRDGFLVEAARFEGMPIHVGRDMIEGKERTFWHLISEGDVEEERTPDLRRCERIRWVRAIIDNVADSAVLSWPSVRGRRKCRCLWLRKAGFLVVLDKRPHCWWLTAAYEANREHTRRRLEREYENWKNANAAFR